MKKRVFKKKLSRGSGARKALFRALIRAQVANGKIVTTKTKAKIIQKKIEKLINIAKQGKVDKRRQVYSILGNDRTTTDLLFSEIVPAFNDRSGGYTRITNLPRRRGDSAEIVRIEWSKEIKVSEKDKSDKPKGEKTKKTVKKRSVWKSKKNLSKK